MENLFCINNSNIVLFLVCHFFFFKLALMLIKNWKRKTNRKYNSNYSTVGLYYFFSCYPKRFNTWTQLKFRNRFLNYFLYPFLYEQTILRMWILIIRLHTELDQYEGSFLTRHPAALRRRARVCLRLLSIERVCKLLLALHY